MPRNNSGGAPAPPTPSPAPRSPSPVPVALFGAGGLAAVLTGAPWWCTVLCLGLTLALGVVQVVFPQDSADRLQWWQNRRQYLQRRRQLRMEHRRRRQQRRAASTPGGDADGPS